MIMYSRSWLDADMELNEDKVGCKSSQKFVKGVSFFQR